MTQKINLNASPYYDDYDSSKNFHKVLYKPGFPVQARELTSQQSILQNQIEKFGDHIFKEGSVVIPGGLAFDNQFSAVKLKSTNFNVDISVYIENYLGKKITGSDSGIEAIVKFIALPDGVNVNDVTLYVNYLSADKNSEFNSFTDGESLTSSESVVYGNTTINPNTPFASLIDADATAIGSAAFISQGVYFVRGFFTNVSDQTIILDYYSNNPSYRVGLQINELIVNAKEDNTLFDNAKGFTNYAAPGADRLKIELVLSKKLLTDKNDTDFIELMRVDEGKIKVMNSKSDYNKIRDWIAERTYEESGDYSVDPYEIGVFNSLNNGQGNGGLFFENETTDQGNEPSKDLMSVKVGPGQAYVRGYNVESTGTTILDVDKPRDVGVRTDIGIGFEMGNILRVNNVIKGSIAPGSTIKLFDNFLDSGGNPAGENIGSARVYSFNLEDAPYTGATTPWELRLFDIQTNTNLTLNQTISNAELPEGSFVKGKSSGASGFAVGAGGGSTIIKLNETSGSFVRGEQIQINGVDFPRTVGLVTAYSTQSIKSVDGGSKFRADTASNRFRLPNGVINVTLSKTTIEGDTATAVEGDFARLRPGAILVYNKPGGGIAYNRVSFVDPINPKGLRLEATTSVAGLRDGELFDTGNNTNLVTVQMFAAAPLVTGTGRLYAPFDMPNVSDVELTDSSIKITDRAISQNVTGNELTLTTSSQFSSISDIVFDTFDQERYSMFNNSTGAPVPLSNGGFQYNSNGDEVKFTDLGISNADVNVTLTKTKVRSKIKEYTRSRKLIINKSRKATSGDVAVGTGVSAISDGLTFDSRYGLRVQDEEISLNLPDVVKFLAVYESTNTSAPVLDKLVFPSSINASDNVIVGENIISDDSQIVARVVSKNVNTIEIVYLTSGTFNSGDGVKFDESNIKTNVQSVELGKYKNLTNSFTLNKGQKSEFYDYSRLVRSKNVPEPRGQLLVVFDFYSVSSDDGDVFTVNSYDEDRFSNDIPNIGNDNIRASDTLDFRPRVSEYIVATDTGSPFQFSQRDFSGTAILRYLAPNESSILSYKNYLARIDKLYINKFGKFIYEKGLSSMNPKPPVKSGELMELATIGLPPYLYNPQNATIVLTDNRRFTMKDIGNIDDRVKNLEEITTLSLLETSAQTLQILDEEGRNRFKTGFFVDSFNNYNYINRNLSSIQINPNAGQLIPFRSRDTLASQITPAASIDISQLDFNTDFELFDPNVKKTGDVITLNYEEVEWITQPYATKTGEVNDIMNVNPYEIPVFSGIIELDPKSDVWTRTRQIEPAGEIRRDGENGTKTDVTLNVNFGTVDDPATISNTRREANWGMATNNGAVPWGNTTTVTNTLFQGEISQEDIIDETILLTNVDTFVRNELQSSGSDDYMRSRNISFVSSGFAAHLRMYLFIDGQKIFDIIPKLLEIVKEPNGVENGSNGSFIVGETVTAYDLGSGQQIMTFKLCRPDHKSGSITNPTETYLKNPYTKNSGLLDIPTVYTPSIDILNIDIKSLAEEAQGDFSGYLTNNAKLVGGQSGAEAYVKQRRLVTDDFGDLLGSCFLRDPYTQPAPSVRIPTGSKEFKLTSSPTNENVAPAEKFGVVAAETRYDAFGTFEEWQETVIIETNTNQVNISGDLSGNIALVEEVEYYDPLAQTFVVGGNVSTPSAVGANKDLNGAFITSVEVYFASVDTVTNSPITCEIRSVTGDARPSRNLLGRSRTLRPKGTDANGNEVTLIEFDAESASKPTKFTFPEPIYLPPGQSYAFVLVAPQSTAYNVWTGRHGGVAVNANTIQEADSGASLIYATQYAMGAIFKSQNGALWTEDQTMDMTFKLYKAKFTSQSGSALFNNPKLSNSNGYVPTLLSNPIETFPKTGKIGIVTTTNSTVVANLVPGRKVAATFATSTGVIVGTGASVNGVSVVTGLGGTNYTSDSEVETFAITGKGSGLKLNMTATDSAVSSVSVVEGGNGYQIGDVVGIVTSTTTTNNGEGAQISIGSTGGIDTLFLTNIQSNEASFATGIAVTYFADGDTTNPTGTISGTIQSRDFDGGVNAGNVAKINHFNHGMYSTVNKVSIRDIESDVEPTTLNGELSRTETNVISVASTSQFYNFEGIPVNTTNPGYVKIGNEIIGYSGVVSGSGDSGTLTIIANGRAIDNTVSTTHRVGTVVRKHELSGVSIRRLEVTQNVAISPSPNLDDYHITFDRGSTYGKDRSSSSGEILGEPELSFNSQSLVGGSNVKGTQNILYGAIIPRYDVLTPSGADGSTTTIEASIRGVSGTSVDGSEASFVDTGFEQVQLNTYNGFENVKLVASKVNEDEYLSNLPSNKSFTTSLNLNSNDENLSPIIRLSSGSETEFVNHRLNSPIGLEDYDTDNRVDSISNDPHAAVYVSNTVRLKNPANSLKVILSAVRPESSDFRVLYSLIRPDSAEISQAFELFPGFKNVNEINGVGFAVVDESKNDGRPDTLVTPSAFNQFKEYEFTADGLPEFVGYTIKIVMSGTNQARPPRISELRTIAIK